MALSPDDEGRCTLMLMAGSVDFFSQAETTGPNVPKFIVGDDSDETPSYRFINANIELTFDMDTTEASYAMRVFIPGFMQEIRISCQFDEPTRLSNATLDSYNITGQPYIEFSSTDFTLDVPRLEGLDTGDYFMVTVALECPEPPTPQTKPPTTQPPTTPPPSQDTDATAPPFPTDPPTIIPVAPTDDPGNAESCCISAYFDDNDECLCEKFPCYQVGNKMWDCQTNGERCWPVYGMGLEAHAVGRVGAFRDGKTCLCPISL